MHDGASFGTPRNASGPDAPRPPPGADLRGRRTPSGDARRVTLAHVPWSGEPPPSTRPPVCRRTGCREPAAADGLCVAHERSQAALRATAARTSGGLAAPVGAWLADLASAREAPWRALAACRGLTAVMYPGVPGEHRPADYAPALALCERCPVVEPCRDAGARECHGMWGGLTPRLRRPRPRVA